VDAGLKLPERLKHVQALMAANDPRAARIYESLGVFLGHGLAQFSAFYPFRHVLVLGRVLSGPGGEILLDWARRVLATEFPSVAEKVTLHLPGESDRRHGQAIAAASLPMVTPV